MAYLYILLALAAALLLYMYFEAGFVKVERIRFSNDKGGLKILHLSDIHINLLRVPTQAVQKAIKHENPDILILSGDYIEKPEDVEKFVLFLRTINTVPNAYLCLGNHDYKAFSKNEAGLESFIETVENFGIHILNNSSSCFEKNKKKYNIIAFDDLREGTPDIDKALQSCRNDAFINVAFTHNPDLALQIPKNKVDYLFCGHLHGGQIWAPFDLEFKLLRRDKLCKIGIKRGLHRLNGINLYISRGLGNVVVPLRFMSRPEITVYYLP
jgi:predicted MPP superfamily phosphohydrolase